MILFSIHSEIYLFGRGIDRFIQGRWHENNQPFYWNHRLQSSIKRKKLIFCFKFIYVYSVKSNLEYAEYLEVKK